MNTDTEASKAFSLQRDAWLSEKLGRAAWQVKRGSDGERWPALTSMTPTFAYAKVEAADVGALWSLSDAGFRVVDAAVTLETTTPVDARGDSLRFALAGDRKAVGRVAGSCFRYSRFHADPLIPPGLAHGLKAEWATNFFTGARGDGMVVAERGGRVVGFTQLIWQADDRLVIDLIGVDEAFQGRGIGRAMIGYAARHGTGDIRRPARLRVGTQVANTPSIRLYESLGFRLIGSQYVLHFHAGRPLTDDANRPD